MLGIAPDTPVDGYNFYANGWDFVFGERSSANIQNTTLSKFILRMGNKSNEGLPSGYSLGNNLSFGYIDANIISGKEINDVISDY